MSINEFKFNEIIGRARNFIQESGLVEAARFNRMARMVPAPGQQNNPKAIEAASLYNDLASLDVEVTVTFGEPCDFDVTKPFRESSFMGKRIINPDQRGL